MCTSYSVNQPLSQISPRTTAHQMKASDTISGAAKRKKLGWPSLRWFRSKETCDQNLDENDEKAQLAERIMTWQQESSQEEICKPMLYAVESTPEKVKTRTRRDPKIRTRHKPKSTLEHEKKLEIQNVEQTSRDTANVSSREKKWHEDILPLAINEGLHSLWAEATKHLPNWLSIDRGPASIDPTRIPTLPICGGERR